MHDPSGHPRWRVLQGRAGAASGPLLLGTTGKNLGVLRPSGKEKRITCALPVPRHAVPAERG